MSTLLGVQNAALVLAPSVPPGMKLWLKADTLALNDGDAMSAWPDSSDQVHDAVQATALKQPVFKTNIVNGLPAVRFTDSPNTGLRTDNVTWDVGHFTLFAVFHKLTSNDGWVFDVGTSVYIRGGVGFYSGNSDTTAVGGPGGSPLSGRSIASGNWADDGVWRVITVRYNGSHASHQFYINGADQGLGTGSGSGAPSGSITQPFNVGSANNAGGPSLPGEIAEVLFYDSTLSDADRALVESYLRSKYAI